jgi:cytochrome c
MDTWEFNKIAGATLAALLLMFGTATLIEIRTSHKAEKPGYVLPVAAPQTAAAGAATAAAGINFAEISSLLHKANVSNGQAAFKRCATCHTPDKGGRNATGPNLWGVVGRPKASVAGFNYSEALKSKGGEWTYEDLANYLHDPRSFAPGNRMAFAGIKDNAELADLIGYLRTLSDSPPPLPN